MLRDGVCVDDNTVRSFLMVGQSNMAGRGELADVEPIRNRACYMLRMGRWQPMAEPINPDRAILEGVFHSGVSLAASFADEAAAFHGGKVGLIPCADGGTKICQWQPGEVLFDHAVMMTKLAMRSSVFSGILWHQGESDCKNFDGAAYAEQFLNTMNGLRRALDAEDLPLIIGEVSQSISPDWGMGDGPARLNRLLEELARELPMCALVRVQDLPLKPDGIHFNAVSCRELGRRYFQQYKALL